MLNSDKEVSMGRAKEREQHRQSLWDKDKLSVFEREKSQKG